MKMRNFIITAVLTLFVGFLAGSTINSISHNFAAQKNITPIPSPAPSVLQELYSEDGKQKANTSAEADYEPQDETYTYTLKEYYGSIAVYKSYPAGQSSIVDIIDVGVDSLPEKDRSMLKSGINVKDEEELLQLIEDYTS